MIILAIIIVLAIIITWAIVMRDNDQFNSIQFMKNADVPTISMNGLSRTKSLVSKIINGGKPKIDFIIKTINDDYTIDVSNYDDYTFSGKGLVIAASGNRYRYVTGLYTNLYTIRKFHKSNIPIEIFYVGKIEEFNKPIYDLIMKLGNIKIIDLMTKLNTNASEKELRGYQTKPLAALCSSFEEVIVMDADALCFIDPANLFNADGVDSGMILFRDYVDCLSFVSQDFIESIGIGSNKYCSYTDNYEIDSSCVILSKRVCWNALYIICIVNVKADAYHNSKNVLGDKDTWLIGSMFADIKPHISKPVPEIFVTNKDVPIVGHLQSTTFSKKKIYTHYNNQMVDLLTADLTDWKTTMMKNPSKKQKIGPTEYIDNNIIESFKYAKEAMKVIVTYVPKDIKSINSVDGVSKGLIP
jgi:hypothetical protein